MNFPCYFLAIFVFISSAKCMYIQEPHGIPRIQALARIGETPAAGVPREIVVNTGRSSSSPYGYGVMSSQQALPPSSYGTNGVKTVVINVAEEPYYPARTVQL